MKHVRALTLALLVLPLPAYAQEKRTVTFGDDVAPLMRRYCAECHHPGGPGPFDLTSPQPAWRYLAPWRLPSLLTFDRLLRQR